ncbi:hypothetical protein L596_021291 [Steinernema carpocapsae]|uniref:SKP1 component POZ domain-containing protein n=1 Tax=Steinernema carpocapsae TaxID=34508 RepID=A0A4U5MJ46_STECR|nr:hypothetical protein L596_021291 [Steinernema carpocapsae]
MTTTYYKIETINGKILKISEGALKMSSTLSLATEYLEDLDEAIPVYDFEADILELVFDYCEKRYEEKSNMGTVGWRMIPVDQAENFYAAAEYLGIHFLCQKEEFY